MINAQWVLNHLDDVKRVIAAVMAEETKEDAKDLKASIEQSVDILFDLLREPLQSLGVDLQRSRGLVDDELGGKVLMRLDKLANIEEFPRK